MLSACCANVLIDILRKCVVSHMVLVNKSRLSLTKISFFFQNKYKRIDLKEIEKLVCQNGLTLDFCFFLS